MTGTGTQTWTTGVTTIALLVLRTGELIMYMYGKCPRISNTLLLTFLAYILLFMQLFLKRFSGISNSVDDDDDH